MSPAKTIYVKDADVRLWERFEIAARRGKAAASTSALVAEAMRQYLAQFGDQGGGLRVLAPDQDPRKVAFGDHCWAVLRREGGNWVLFMDAARFGDAGPHVLMARSSPVADAVAAARAYLSLGPQPKDLERIEVYCADRVEAFLGRWLVYPDPELTRADEADQETANWDAEAYWGVAVTKRGRFAVYVAHAGDAWPSGLTVYDTIDEAVNEEMLTPSIAALARSELADSPAVIERDI